MFDNNRVKGPYTYVFNEIYDERIFLISASKYNTKDWVPVVIPHVGADRNDYLLLEFEYRELFNQFIKPILDGDLLRVGPIPEQYPQRTIKLRSCAAKFLSKIGQLSVFFMLLIVILHTGVFMLFGLCIVLFSSHWPCFYATSFMGVIVTPCIIVYVLLSQASIWDEIQSWMIAYIVWGLIAYIILMIYVGAVYFTEDSEDYLDIFNDLLMLILGIDIGDLNINTIIMSNNFVLTDVIRGRKMDVLILMMGPFVASLLPATIVGFIASYFLSEKFELDCKDEYLEGDICFDSETGCCKLLSSHEWNNIYYFMGGLASNILAMWAIIRIFGYFMAYADPFFASYVRRRRH